MRVAALGLVGLALLAACGPIDPGLAADQCEERARQADGPFGEIQVGTVRGRAAGSVEVGITSDFLAGRDPFDVYDRCVRAKTGQGPVRPLELRR
ncbi:MAG: hypothetical protein MUF73_15680 [Rhodobacteraceae bacterium]|jgi:hypothetical protein|nr:hypothetical protein [Paracoccaceae bacterium]